MLTSKWFINRIGLVDFWYYDEEEFWFRDGRLLLKGSNGSGKSVTMQSFIPLLLDGNKASERLDPFGTKARRLDNYLLEEGDGREERTGYLYMEFKRKNSDTYTTIGMGLNAKRGKKLDSWYFCINDGRRIGKDFFLYKDMKDKIPYTKLELTNRIGQGGQVVTGQREYMKLVNDTLFGYESVEDYKELIDLLIQLRTPKLSKDFKPTVLNEILSNSLPPLSDDDMRPMSEAIENMDNLKARMDSLERSVKAADRILEVYRQYNRAVLSTKANWFLRALEKKKQYEIEHKQCTESISNARNQMVEAKEREERLKQEEQLTQQKINHLTENDGKKLAERKVQLISQQQDIKKDLEEKRGQQSRQEAREKDLERAVKREREKEEQLKDELYELLSEMEECFQVLDFDENAFLCSELSNEITKEYSFDVIKQSIRQKRQQLKEGIDCLHQYARLKKVYDEIQIELTKMNSELKSLEGTKEQYETQLHQVQDEWEEHFYQWIRNNELLIISETVQQQVVQSALSFNTNSDITVIKEPLRLVMERKREELSSKMVQLEHERTLLVQELEAKQSELKDWENKKDPEPERSDEVKANRRWLTEQKIPHYALYQVVDFVETVSKEKRDRLEEALYRMGVLDAVIVPSNYQEQVVTMREGMCDQYLFADAVYVKESIEQLLEISTQTDDIIFYTELNRLLSEFGVSTEGSTWIQENGVYRMGILRGTITGEYKAKYIGVRARQQYRSEKIAELAAAVQEALEAVQNKENELEELHVRLEQLKSEYESYPKMEDIRIAIQDVEKIERDILYQTEKIDKKEVERRTCYESVKQLGILVAEYSHKLYLKAELTLFEQAFQEIDTYQETIFQLERNHEKYRNQIRLVELQQEYFEECQEQLDHIRYDVGSNERQLAVNQQELECIEEELKRSGYDKIEEELMACMQRMKVIPEELKECYLMQSAAQKDDEKYQEELERIQGFVLSSKQEVELTQEGFLQESKLSYVEDTLPMEQESVEAYAKRIYKLCQINDGKMVSDLQGTFQERFFSNTSELVEFHVSQRRIFQEEETKERQFGYQFQRIDVIAKYKGKEVPFHRLCEGLKEDMEVQRQLVKESDRALFQDILANTISKKIRYKIYHSEIWVERMNQLMNSMNTSSGLKLSLVWKKKKAEEENQLNTKELVDLLKKDAGLMTEEELDQLSKHFQSKVEEARRILADIGNSKSFHAIMREVLDYRKWFEFQLYYEKTGDRRKELTNNAFFTFSGGEKAMSMYVPLFSAVVAKYQGAREDAPRLVSLDEAFAGVDEQNIRDMFRLMVELDFEFIINSQILWGDYDTVPSLAIYQLIRKENAKYVTVLPYIWNGNKRIIVTDVNQMESLG